MHMNTLYSIYVKVCTEKCRLAIVDQNPRIQATLGTMRNGSPLFGQTLAEAMDSEIFLT